MISLWTVTKAAGDYERFKFSTRAWHEGSANVTYKDNRPGAGAIARSANAPTRCSSLGKGRGGKMGYPESSLEKRLAYD
jgi:hypothetical protein